MRMFTISYFRNGKVFSPTHYPENEKKSQPRAPAFVKASELLPKRYLGAPGCGDSRA